MKNLLLSIILLAGCHEVQGVDTPLEAPEQVAPIDTETTPEEQVAIEDATPRHWIVIEHAMIASWKVEIDDYLPDPWAVLYRQGDQMGTTASCDMETYKPIWRDHMAAKTLDQWLADEWSIVVYDYELEPGGNSWLGGCVVEARGLDIEHGLTVKLEDCGGAIDSITITFEPYAGEIDVEAEKDPTC